MINVEAFILDADKYKVKMLINIKLQHPRDKIYKNLAMLFQWA